MQVIRAAEKRVRRVCYRHMAGGAVQDVEDEMPIAILLIGDERAAGRRIPMDADRRHVDAVSPEPLYVERAKIVVADAADHATRLA